MTWVPAWFFVLSVAFLSLGTICCLIIVVDLLRHPQHMWIMNVVLARYGLVWVGLGSAWIVWQYFRYGRLAERRLAHEAMQKGEEPPNRKLTPFAVMVANGTLHCGSGCTLGDITAESLMIAFPAIVASFGYKGIFSDQIFARWIVDYIFAYGFGIIFQYFTIAPMRGLSLGNGILAAIKADTFSLTAWQFGMYGFMAIAQFVVFHVGFGPALEPTLRSFGS